MRNTQGVRLPLICQSDTRSSSRLDFEAEYSSGNQRAYKTQHGVQPREASSRQLPSGRATCSRRDVVIRGTFFQLALLSFNSAPYSVLRPLLTASQWPIRAKCETHSVLLQRVRRIPRPTKQYKFETIAFIEW